MAASRMASAWDRMDLVKARRAWGKDIFGTHLAAELDESPFFGQVVSYFWHE
jgi:hypothetical protein